MSKGYPKSGYICLNTLLYHIQRHCGRDPRGAVRGEGGLEGPPRPRPRARQQGTDSDSLSQAFLDF